MSTANFTMFNSLKIFDTHIMDSSSTELEYWIHYYRFCLSHSYFDRQHCLQLHKTTNFYDFVPIYIDFCLVNYIESKFQWVIRILFPELIFLFPPSYWLTNELYNLMRHESKLMQQYEYCTYLWVFDGFYAQWKQ